MKRTLSRRAILGTGLTGLALSACAKPEQYKLDEKARGSRRLTMTTTWPKGLAGLHTTAEYIANRIEKLSAGRITMNVYAAGELVPPLQAFDAVADGSVDISHCGSGYWTSKSKAFPFFTTVPMGMTVPETLAWLRFGGGQELWDKLTAQFGVKSLAAGTTGHQMGGFFRKPIESLDDFAGLRYRIAGLGADVVRAMGGAAVTIPGGEVFTALQTGTIDATEFVGPWNDRALGFGRVAPYYYGPGFHEPGSVMSLDINKNLWDSFDEEEKLLFETVSSDACAYTLAQYHHHNALALKDMVSEDGIKLRQFPKDVIEAVKDSMPGVLQKVADSGTLEAEIVASYVAHLEKYADWTRIGDGGFIGMR